MDLAAFADMQIPLAQASYTPVQVAADYYYQLPVRPIYKSYPVYLSDRAPKDYLEWLREQNPEITFDASKLRSDEDWIRAGELVFDAPIIFARLDTAKVEESYMRWHRELKLSTPADGTIPFFRIVIQKKGTPELGVRSCGSCHTRVQPDGSLIKGAQGTFPNIMLGFGSTTDFARKFARFLYATPWILPDPLEAIGQMSGEEINAMQAAIPAGVIARHGSSPFFPTQVPDLIGVKDRKYLDHTGLLRHSGPSDLMRYAAMNQGGDDLASYGSFIPVSAISGQGTLPLAETQSRYSDEQLYALALYLDSLKPPANPNKPNALSVRGEKVFQREGCAVCHTPPLYTNNKLSPALGFTVPAEHKQKYDILPVSVGTDPTLAMSTRRGTGYYKVPSLKGLWYRGPFEHSGSVATLEDWFDAERLRDDYVPTGFKGYGRNARAVKGHAFGLKLSVEDKAALFAFLKTL